MSKEPLLISTILALVLPLANSVDADLSARIQVAPGLNVSLHSDSYYTQREDERRNNQRLIQADRNAEIRRQQSFDRERQREGKSVFFWRDTREQHAQKQRVLEERNRRNEQARANREQAMRDEENRDRDERNHQKDERQHQQDDQRHREEDQRRP